MRPLLAIHRAAIALLIAAVVAPALAQDAPRRIRPLGKHRVALPCVSGYVWREAFAGDAVCVDPPRRDAVASENAMAASRVEPGGGPYGPDTCRSGYVWREARPADHVCVTPDSRMIVARENARAPQLVSRCGTPENCQREAQQKQAEVDRLRQQIAQRQRDLAKARDDQRRLMEQLRKDDEAWARAHPGLGRSTQPSITDNVTPIEQDINGLKAALQEAEQQAATARAQAAPR